MGHREIVLQLNDAFHGLDASIVITGREAYVRGVIPAGHAIGVERDRLLVALPGLAEVHVAVIDQGERQPESGIARIPDHFVASLVHQQKKFRHDLILIGQRRQLFGESRLIQAAVPDPAHPADDGEQTNHRNKYSGGHLGQALSIPCDCVSNEQQSDTSRDRVTFSDPMAA